LGLRVEKAKVEVLKEEFTMLRAQSVLAVATPITSTKKVGVSMDI